MDDVHLLTARYFRYELRLLNYEEVIIYIMRLLLIEMRQGTIRYYYSTTLHLDCRRYAPKWIKTKSDTIQLHGTACILFDELNWLAAIANALGYSDIEILFARITKLFTQGFL